MSITFNVNSMPVRQDDLNPEPKPEKDEASRFVVIDVPLENTPAPLPIAPKYSQLKPRLVTLGVQAVHVHDPTTYSLPND